VDTSNLHGRTVLVTGAGSGIGRETALLAARRGGNLALCDVNDAGLAEVETTARALGRAATLWSLRLAGRTSDGARVRR
jgi:NAD(P)-dependent dehydrogenase (short-subunit alcohol dehydrogenase family)